MAVAALAIVAVAAAMMLAGGAPAQATTASLTPDSGKRHLLPMATDPTPTPTRIHATREPCPGETGNANTTADVVDSGHIALPHGYWNPVEGELTDASCPPTVEHVPAQPKNGTKPATPARDERSPSSINIDETIIHIPNSAKIDLSTSTDYPRDRYAELWAANDAEGRNGSGIGDRNVWALQGCPPDGPSDSVMCLMFSAALLNSADWTDSIEYHIDHVHQIDIDKQDPMYTLAYEEPAASATGKSVPSGIRPMRRLS